MILLELVLGLLCIGVAYHRGRESMRAELELLRRALEQRR